MTRSTASPRPAFPSADLAGLEAVLGSAVVDRGREVVRRDAVLQAVWDPTERVLIGMVRGRGRGREVYATTAYFEHEYGQLDLVAGECTCPVGVDCKHVAALVLSAVGRAGRPAPAPARSWEQVLGGACGDRRSGAVPLGLTLGLRSRTLTARLVMPGRSGWIMGGLTWTKVARMDPARSEHEGRQVRALRDLYALHPAATELYDHYCHRAVRPLLQPSAGEGPRSRVDRQPAVLVDARRRGRGRCGADRLPMAGRRRRIPVGCRAYRHLPDGRGVDHGRRRTDRSRRGRLSRHRRARDRVPGREIGPVGRLRHPGAVRAASAGARAPPAHGAAHRRATVPGRVSAGAEPQGHDRIGGRQLRRARVLRSAIGRLRPVRAGARAVRRLELGLPDRRTRGPGAGARHRRAVVPRRAGRAPDTRRAGSARGRARAS